MVTLTATSSGDGTKTDQVRGTTSSTSANLTLAKSADRATVAPGQDIVYTVNASNGSGLTDASTVVLTDPIPTYTGFKVGSASFSAGTSTLSGTAVYSEQFGLHLDVLPVIDRLFGPFRVRLLRHAHPLDHNGNHAHGHRFFRILHRRGEVAKFPFAGFLRTPPALFPDPQVLKPEN